jgi:hypothetical protein
MPGKQTPCEMASRGVFSFVLSSDRGTSCFDRGAGGSVEIAEGAMVCEGC